VKDRCGWTTFIAMVRKDTSANVLTGDGEFTTVYIKKTLQSLVFVTHQQQLH